MIFGITLATYTLVHVIISLVGIAAGLIALFGWLTAGRMPAVNAVFLITTLATSITGFGFPSTHFGPPHYVGMVSLVVLAIAMSARYAFHLEGGARWVYAITATIALYLNVFVGVVQAFQKVPVLNALAPKQTEAPFAVTQIVVLVVFIVLGIKASRAREPMPSPAM